MTVSFYIMNGMVVVPPLFFLRIPYSVLNAANLDTMGHTGYTTKYNIMSANWMIYVVLGLIPLATLVSRFILPAEWLCG